MTFDPLFYAVTGLGGIERNDAPILVATACPSVPLTGLKAGARFSAAEQDIRKQIDGAR